MKEPEKATSMCSMCSFQNRSVTAPDHEESDQVTEVTLFSTIGLYIRARIVKRNREKSVTSVILLPHGDGLCPLWRSIRMVGNG